MLSKKTSIKNRKQTIREIGQQIYELRRQHRMSLDVLSHKANVPPIIIERWEIGKGYLDLYYLHLIAAVFDKHIVIRFEDIGY